MRAETETPAVLEGEIDNTRQPNPKNVAVGDLVAGRRIGSNFTTIGVVERMEPIGGAWRQFHYTVRVADLFPNGDVERATLHGDVVVIAESDKRIGCPTCGRTHYPAGFVDCVTDHVRADRERTVCRGHVYAFTAPVPD